MTAASKITAMGLSDRAKRAAKVAALYADQVDVEARFPKEGMDALKAERLMGVMIRPELGSICGTILVFVFFLLVARDSGMFSAEGVLNWGVVSAQFAIIAVGACLLMIAGEFDLSVGSMIGFSGIVIALMSVTWGFPMWIHSPPEAVYVGFYRQIIMPSIMLMIRNSSKLSHAKCFSRIQNTC